MKIIALLIALLVMSMAVSATQELRSGDYELFLPTITTGQTLSSGDYTTQFQVDTVTGLARVSDTSANAVYLGFFGDIFISVEEALPILIAVIEDFGIEWISINWT